jgi:hypothetical protein
VCIYVLNYGAECSLSVVGEVEGEVEVGFFEELDYTLQFVAFGAAYSDFFTLDLWFNFGVIISVA